MLVVLMGIKYTAMKNEDIAEACSKMAREAKERFGTPECIIYMERGGMVPARLMSDHLDCSNVVGIRTKKYLDVGKADKLVIDRFSRKEIENLDIKSGHVLIVDDISDSGETFVEVKKLISEILPNVKIVTAAPVYKEGTKHIPDISPIKVGHENWVVFEYEYNETKRSFEQQKNLEALAWLKGAF